MNLPYLKMFELPLTISKWIKSERKAKGMARFEANENSAPWKAIFHNNLSGGHTNNVWPIQRALFLQTQKLINGGWA